MSTEDGEAERSRSPTLPASIAKALHRHSRHWKAFALICFGLANVQLVIWYTSAREPQHGNAVVLGVPFAEVDNQSTTSGTSASSPSPSTKQPLSILGLSADESYKLGATDPVTYRDSLADFIHTHFPPKIQKSLIYGLSQYFPKDGLNYENLPAMTDYQNGWQTDKTKHPVTSSWTRHNPGWKWEMLGDAEMEQWVNKYFAGSAIKDVWDALPVVILKADMLRYLLLLVHGGVYTDTDTSCLKSISEWGGNAKLWKDGDGWLAPSRKDQTLESVKQSLGPPSVIVGVEADVGNRPDWQDWYARPLQIVQWTLASAPTHPIMLDALSRIVRTSEAFPAWKTQRAANITQLRAQGQNAAADKLAKILPWAEPTVGGHCSVMQWTGPGVLTDSVFRYLRARCNFTWPDLQNLKAPLRVCDVVILPVTGFSPGVGQFGAQGTGDAQAMVHHRFAGSWKAEALGWKGSSH
ncbi:membrane-bound alpha-1,6- mannosyltransferase Initiation-specific [Tulasnella sp. JGI-2019a]|nr:membrane-bound alpha-1,6- mannosyltransferase Initiation-specific [Tulasnella sp. JGI-2019a]